MNNEPLVVSRNFVSIRGKHGHRQVHYRRAGDGPCLVLLHQSPQSSPPWRWKRPSATRT